MPHTQCIPYEYTQIINKIDNLVYVNNETIESAQGYNKYVIDLFEIAIYLYKFKEKGGNLQKNYGQGFLIDRFFFRVNCISSTMDNFFENQLMELDKELGDDLGIYIYRNLLKERSEFLKNRDSNNLITKNDSLNHQSSMFNNLLAVIEQGEKIRLKAGIPSYSNNHTVEPAIKLYSSLSDPILSKHYRHNKQNLENSYVQYIEQKRSIDQKQNGNKIIKSYCSLL